MDIRLRFYPDQFELTSSTRLSSSRSDYFACKLPVVVGSQFYHPHDNSS